MKLSARSTTTLGCRRSVFGRCRVRSRRAQQRVERILSPTIDVDVAGVDELCERGIEMLSNLRLQPVEELLTEHRAPLSKERVDVLAGLG